MSHRDWLFSYPRLIATSFYVYVRLILEHGKFKTLLDQEVSFCSYLIREKVITFLYKYLHHTNHMNEYSFSNVVTLVVISYVYYKM
jgi:hypothetical protein